MNRAITPALVRDRDAPEQLPVQPAPESSSLLAALVSAARDSSTDITKMERIFAMHKEIMLLQAESEFNDALARAQGRLEPARKNAKNTQTNSMYATFASVMAVVSPAMTAEGLSLTFRPEMPKEAGNVRMVGILAKGGYKREYPLELPLDQAGAQGKVNKTMLHATTSSGTYCQRILTKLIFGISEDWEDQDGNLTTQRPAQPEPQQPQEKPKYPDAQFDGSLPAWTDLIKSGKKSAAQIISTVESKYVMSTVQKDSLHKLHNQEGGQ
jgi:hypothetical protein